MMIQNPSFQGSLRSHMVGHLTSAAFSSRKWPCLCEKWFSHLKYNSWEWGKGVGMRCGAEYETGWRGKESNDKLLFPRQPDTNPPILLLLAFSKSCLCSQIAWVCTLVALGSSFMTLTNSLISCCLSFPIQK